MLLTQPLLTYPGCLYFGSLLCWKSQSWPQIYMAPSIPSSICCSRQAPLFRKAPHKHDRLGWCSWDCSHSPSSYKYGVWNLYQKNPHLIWPHYCLPCWIIQMVIGELQTAWTCDTLSRGPCAHCRIFGYTSASLRPWLAYQFTPL